MSAKGKSSNRSKKNTIKDAHHQDDNPDLQSILRFHEQYYSETENRFEEIRNYLSIQQKDASGSEFVPSTMTMPFGQKFIQYKNFFYIGEVKNGKPYGMGKFFYRNGSWEEGEYKNFARVGSGSIKYPNGMIFAGEWGAKGMEGEGMAFYPTWQGGAVYSGQFVNGKMHGKGIINFKTGNWYNGDWEMGKISGQGTYYNAKSNKFDTGQFKNGIRTGYGVTKWNDEVRYEGTWNELQGKFSGEGTMYLPNGDTETGKWVDGEWIGEKTVKNQEKFPETFPGISHKFTVIFFITPWVALVVAVILTWISRNFWFALLIAGVGSVIAFLFMIVLIILQLAVERRIKKILTKK
jgi:hypothetical protein